MVNANKQSLSSPNNNVINQRSLKKRIYLDAGVVCAVGTRL